MSPTAESPTSPTTASSSGMPRPARVVRLRVIPDLQVLDCERAPARVVAPDDVVEAADLALVAGRGAPRTLERPSDDPAVHVQPHGVPASCDPVPVPDAGDVDPPTGEPRDRVADSAVTDGARPDDGRVRHVAPEEDGEMEPGIPRVDAVLDLKVHVPRAAKVV